MRLAATLVALSFTAAAQTPLPLPNTPTTKILAIGTTSSVPTAAIMQHEVPDTVRLFLAGKIDQWYSRKDARGVVFIMNVSSVEEANALLEKLPLGQAGIMKFQLIPLGPLAPLGLILPPADAPAK